MTKHCNVCNNDKDISMFYRDRTQKCGIRSCCKSCDNISTEIWREKNKDKYLARQRKRQHSNPSRKARKIRSQQHRNELSDMYIRSLITRKHELLNPEDIPDDFVKVYKENLRLKRKLGLTPKLKNS